MSRFVQNSALVSTNNCAHEHGRECMKMKMVALAIVDFQLRRVVVLPHLDHLSVASICSRSVDADYCDFVTACYFVVDERVRIPSRYDAAVFS